MTDPLLGTVSPDAITGLGSVYNGPTLLTNPKLVWMSGTVSNGVLTLHPTKDGTATGSAIFNNIYGVMASLAIDGSTYQMGAYTVSTGNQTVTIPITKSTPTSVTVLGVTTQVLTAPVAANGGTISVLLAGN